jgi:hypothetical protein
VLFNCGGDDALKRRLVFKAMGYTRFVPMRRSFLIASKIDFPRIDDIILPFKPACRKLMPKRTISLARAVIPMRLIHQSNRLSPRPFRPHNGPRREGDIAFMMNSRQAPTGLRQK